MFCNIFYIFELLIKLELSKRLVIPQKGTVLCCTKVKTRRLIVSSNYTKTVLYGNDEVKCHQRQFFRLGLSNSMTSSKRLITGHKHKSPAT